MLINFVLNIMDTFNIVYLWANLTKRDNNFLKLISSVVIISIILTITNEVDLNFIIIYIIEIIIIKCIYRRDFKNVIFGLLLALLIIMLMQLMISLIMDKFIYDDIVKGIVIELIIFVCMGVFFKSSLHSNKFILKKINNNVLIYFITTSSIYVIILKFIWNYDNKIIMDNLFIASATLSILLLSNIFTYLYVIKIIKEKEALKVSNEYNSVINEIVQEIRQRQHDFINYKNTIRGIVEVTDDKDVKPAIKNYMKDEDMYDNKINELMYINHVVIRSVIYRTICKAKEYNINFKYKIENNVLDNILTYHEISNVLNNLLNNAFDEVLKDECVKKDIEIKILNEKGTSHLIVKNQIVNPKEVNLNEMFTRGYSTKNTTGTRGYGLYNVQQIVNLHKGYVKLNVECEEIIFDIYFNNSSGKSGSPKKLLQPDLDIKLNTLSNTTEKKFIDFVIKNNSFHINNN